MTLVETETGRLPRAPEMGMKRLHRPSSAPGSSRKRCLSLAMQKGPVLYFHYPARAPWRRPAGCLALQNLFTYMGAEGIGSFSAQPRSLSAGGLSRLPPGARVGLRPSEKAWGTDLGSAAPCLQSCCGVLAPAREWSGSSLPQEVTSGRAGL